MKKSFTLIVLSFVTVWALALPKVHVIATGGTIAGTLSGSGYDAGQVTIEDILAAVPELNNYAELDYEQFCNIGSQDMNETIWLSLAKRINQVQQGDSYDAVIVTHGTDTMEETAYFLNLTTHSPKPIVLVGSMRPSDSPEADGPKNLMVAVKIRDYFSKAIVTEIRQMRVAERAASVRAYTLQGTPATVSTSGIVIQNQIKIVRK